MCALHYKSKLIMKSRIDCSIDHCDGGVIKPLFPCFLLWYLNPRGCGCNSFLLRVTNGWLWSPEEEGALSQRQERTGDLYRGVGTRGRILGNFTALASPSAVQCPWREQQRVLITLSKSDTDTIMSDVENIHHPASQWIERSVQRQEAKMGCRP